MSVMSSVHFPGVCVQVSLQIHTQAVKIKRSCVVKGESDPHFSYRMTFKLRPQHLDEACLRFELQQPQEVRSGERFILKWIKLSVCLTQAHIAGHLFYPPEPPVLLGVLVLGPFMYARGPQLQHWMDMVNTPQEPVKLWHRLCRAT